MNMRKRKAAVSFVAAASLGLLAACGGGDGGSSSGDEVKLIVSNFVTEEHATSTVQKTWMEEVTKRSDGDITFEEFYNGSLCAAPDAITCAEDGTADIVMAVPAYNPDMAVANIGSVAFQGADQQAKIDAINKLYADEEEYRNDYEKRGLKMLYTIDNSPPTLATVKPIKELNDVKNQSIRATSGIGDGLKMLGANTVATDPAEIYEALQRGVVDGAAFPVESHLDYKIDEVAPNMYDLGEYSGSYAMNTWTMNLESFDSLSDEHQKIMGEVSAEVAGTYVTDVLVPVLEQTCTTLKKNDRTVEKIGPEEVGEKWADEASAVQRADWEKSVAEDVKDPAAMFDSYLANMEEASSGYLTSVADICAGV